MSEPLFAVKVDLPEDPVYVVTHETFIVDRRQVPAFLNDLMTSMSSASRSHGASMLGGETSILDMKGETIGPSE